MELPDNPSPTPEDPEDIVARVNRLSRTLDKTVHRADALRIVVLGLLAALARHDPAIAAAIMRDLIRLLDETAGEAELQPYSNELVELREDLRRELVAVLQYGPTKNGPG